MSLALSEIMETIRMVQMENLDIRTVTVGISLLDCQADAAEGLNRRIYDKITRTAERLVPVARAIESELGLPIVNKRLAVTPIGLVAGNRTPEELVRLAETLDRAARELGVDFLGGFSALVQKGATPADERLMEAIPAALSGTERVCGSVSVASTAAGINMDAVGRMGEIIVEAARRSADRCGIACAKLVVFANPVGDNPFMAGAFHGPGEPAAVVNVGVSGPGVVLSALQRTGEVDLGQVSEVIKKTAFKVTRMGELVGRLAAERMGLPFGIVDLSLAPTNAQGDSVAEILEAMGLERVGTHGSTAALALMNDAVKKGGAMATSYTGGLSGAFIPVSEDEGMSRAVREGVLTFDKLEAMTSVCSVGLDMIALPGETPPETIAAIIADEAAIGVINRKTTAVRVIPVPGKKAGDEVEFGGLLGRAPILPVHTASSAGFVRRGGRIPAPLQSLIN